MEWPRLADRPVTKNQRLVALAVVAAMLVAILSIAPALHRRLGVVPFFFGAWVLVFVGSEALTAGFLFFRTQIDRSLGSAILAGTYAFSAVLVVANTLALPGVGGLDGAFGIGLHSARYCWLFLHLGFPLGIGLSILAGNRRFDRSPWIAAAGSIGIGALAIFVAYTFGPGLPALATHGVPTPFFATCLVVMAVVATSSIVASCRVRERQTSLQLWTAVALVAFVFDSFLTSFAGGAYTLGWYAARLLSATAGSVVLVAVATEATQLFFTLRARLAGQESLRDLAGSIPQIIFTARPDGIVDWANERWFAYTGVTEQEAYGIGWFAVHHPAETAELKRRWRAEMVAGKEFVHEFRLRGSDGTFRWFSNRVVPVRDENGAVIRWYGSLTDIDEQRRQATHLRELYAREHRIANALQTAFLPSSFPECAGIAFSHVYNPASEDENVGGDWYDAFTLPDGRVAVCVGDVSGHGLDAAVRMLRAREVVRAAAIGDPTPSKVLGVTARTIATESDQLITALYGVVDRERGTFRYASAGHPPPAWLHDGVARLLPYGGMPLGIDETSTFVDHEIEIGEGDVLALYTDGLIEATRDSVEGERKLLALLASGVTDAGSLSYDMVGDRKQDDVAVATIAVGPRNAADTRRRGWHFHTVDASLARGARPSFALYLRACGIAADDIATAELIFGELLGNVVRHAPGPVEIGFVWTCSVGRLRVADRGAGLTLGSGGAQSPSLFAESGRGWLIIETLGLTPRATARPGGGTEVVVEIPFSASAVAAPAPAPFGLVVPLRSA